MITWKCEKCNRENRTTDPWSIASVLTDTQMSVECSRCESPHLITVTVKTLNDDFRDEQWLTNAYVTNKYTMAQIARMCGVTPMTIQNWLRRHDIPTRGRGRGKSAEGQ